MMMKTKIIALLFGWLLWTNPVLADICQSTAVAITDGDTITAYCQGKKVSIRLAAIDAPEKKQAYGKAAKNYLATLVQDKPLTIDIVDEDRYGRLVGNIFIDKIYINLQMVQSGYAWVYTDYQNAVAKGWLKRILSAQSDAKKHKKGLWQDEKPEAPWHYRQHSKKLGNLGTLWNKLMKLFD